MKNMKKSLKIIAISHTVLLTSRDVFFGVNGAQRGDGVSSVSREKQIARTVSFFLDVVKGTENG